MVGELDLDEMLGGEPARKEPLVVRGRLLALVERWTRRYPEVPRPPWPILWSAASGRHSWIALALAVVLIGAGLTLANAGPDPGFRGPLGTYWGWVQWLASVVVLVVMGVLWMWKPLR